MKKFIISGVIVILAALITIPFAFYITGRMPLATRINGIEVGGMMAEDAYQKIIDSTPESVITLTRGEEVLTEIRSSEYSTPYIEMTELTEIRSLPHHFEVIAFVDKDVFIPIRYEVNEEALNNTIKELNGTEESENAYLSYDIKTHRYVIVPDKTGTVFDKEEVTQLILDALKTQQQTTIDITDSFITAGITADNKELVDKLEELNKLLDSSITYEAGDKKIVLDSSTFINWIEKDDNGMPYMENESYAYKPDMIDAFIEELVLAFNTVAVEKEFIANDGSSVMIEDGTYGWEIDIEKEREQLLADLLSGEAVIREPVWAKQANGFGTQEVGNTYVEVSLDAQHLWYYKDGEVVMESDVVSGNRRNKTESDKGFWFLKSKTNGKYLIGPTWKTWVDYWMPYNNSGEGLHDASWRNKFGGNIYRTNGSHGCVNLPSDFAAEIFEELEVGTPIVIY